MDGNEWIVEEFEANRAYLRGVGFRMVGSRSEADDAVQEAWLRLSGAIADIANPQAWLTTAWPGSARTCCGPEPSPGVNPVAANFPIRSSPSRPAVQRRTRSWRTRRASPCSW
jgi:hypothetical protein